MNVRQYVSMAVGLAVAASSFGSQRALAAEAPRLQEIIVTAQRQAQDLQKVPVSVTALSGKTLQQQGLTDINQLFLAAPTVQLGTDNGVTIRGIGTLSFSRTLESSVGTSIDGVSLGRAFLNTGVLSDIAQIQVLNGPQGLLFGKNATAGLIDITTVRPQLGRFEGSVRARYAVRDTTPGDGASVITTGVLNVPVSANSALRIDADYSKQDPVARIKAFAGNPRIDQQAKNFGFRAKYLLQISDALSVYLIGDYDKQMGVAGVFDRTYRSLGPGSQYTNDLPADGITPGPTNLFYGDSGAVYRDLSSEGLQARIAYRLPNGYQLVNIAAWDGYHLNQNYDLDGTTTNYVDTNHTQNGYHQYSEELRLVLPHSRRLNGQLGLYVFGLNLHEANVLGGLLGFTPAGAMSFPFCVGAQVSAGGPPNCNVDNSYFLGNDENYLFTSRSYAGYGQFTFNVTDSWALIAGGRFTHDRIGINLAQNQLNFFVPLGPRANRDQSNSHSNFSWKLGTQYQATRNAMLYATYATGYKGPGYNSSPPTPTANMLVNPETVRSIEVGARTTWLSDRLMANVSLFDERFTNYQVQSFNQALQAFVLQNADSMSSRGAELDLQARPVGALTLGASLALAQARFGNFPGAQCYPGQPDCSTSGTFNAIGNSTPQSAKFTGTLDARYSFPLTDTATGYIGATYYYRSSVNYDISNSPLTEVGPAHLVGASLGADFGGGWQAEIYCKNCTNDVIPAGMGFEAGDASSGIATVIQSWDFNSVRTIGVTVDYKF